MKIRAGFVTNSSSVSYIVTLHLDMVGIDERGGWEGSIKENEKLVLARIKKRLMDSGTRVMLEGEEIYTDRIEFSTDETMTAEAYERAHDEVDLSSMDDDDLWAYIYGEYILCDRIRQFRGIGVTQVETY